MSDAAPPPPWVRIMAQHEAVRAELIVAATGKACRAIYEIQAYGDIVAARRMLEQAAAMLARAQGMSTVAVLATRAEGRPALTPDNPT